MADKQKPDSTPLEIARITSRWQIMTAMIGVGAGIIIAILSNDALFRSAPAQTCNAMEVEGSYGEGESWEFEMDVVTGQFESENQAGDARIDGNMTVLCTGDRLSARIEGRRSAGGAPILCLFHGRRTGAEGRAVSGRFLCDDLPASENANGYWRGDIRLMSDV